MENIEFYNYLNNNFEHYINIRRELHKNAELGFETFKTTSIITDELDNLKIKYEIINKTGILVEIGNGPKTLLLRADTDALPMYEENDLEFKSTSGVSHCCGHDIHTTILLGLIKSIKEEKIKFRELKLLFLFQPDEEGGTGAKTIINSRVYKKYKIDYALALHVDAKLPLGKIEYGYGETFASNDSFNIKIIGRGGHGARIYETIDPINLASNISNIINNILRIEFDPFEQILFSITSFEAVSNYNIIIDDAILKGSLRTYDSEVRKRVLKRIEEVIDSMTKLYGGKGSFDVIKSLPELKTSKKFTEKILGILEGLESSIDIINIGSPVIKRGSEDFAYITNIIEDSSYLFIGAGPNVKEGFKYGQHNSKVIFNEKSIIVGIMTLANIVRKL